MSRQKRDIFLATCLLESIEDENYRFVLIESLRLFKVFDLSKAECCLLFYRNTKKLLTEHQANPNLLIPESNIAAIHYAAGMENVGFAEAAMKLILKCNGKYSEKYFSDQILVICSNSIHFKGDPNVQTVDGETPLHVAVIWNRTLIVKMLLVSVE